MINKNRLRIFTIIVATLTLLWSGTEDTNMQTTVGLGLVWAVLVVIWMSHRVRSDAFATKFIVPTLFGIIGFLAPTIGVGLMFFKNARHAHPFPDYPLPLMVASLRAIPIWVLAGTLFGIGVLFALWVWRDLKSNPSPIQET